MKGNSPDHRKEPVWTLAVVVAFPRLCDGQVIRNRLFDALLAEFGSLLWVGYRRASATGPEKRCGRGCR